VTLEDVVYREVQIAVSPPPQSAYHTCLSPAPANLGLTLIYLTKQPFTPIWLPSPNAPPPPPPPPPPSPSASVGDWREPQGGDGMGVFIKIARQIMSRSCQFSYNLRRSDHTSTPFACSTVEQLRSDQRRFAPNSDGLFFKDWGCCKYSSQRHFQLRFGRAAAVS
jgi:hypothetical protein